MENKTHKRLPKILKINRIDKKHLRISVLFSNGEDRILDFENIFKKEWKVTKADPEYKLFNPNEFAKVKVANHTLSWDNADLFMTGFDGKKKKVPYEVGADTLYDLSAVDEKLTISVGSLFRKARKAANLSQEKVAELSGTSRTYITKLENDGGDVEIMTLKKLVEAGLNRHLSISID
jgi:DNA-binding XRE family transcriptional regulator